MELLLWIFAVFAGTFGVAIIRICFTKPRSLVFIMVGISLYLMCLKNNEKVRRFLKRLTPNGERNGHSQLT